MSKVAIVTDSTCDLGPEWLKEHDVRMVPLKVMFGEDSFLDWIELAPCEFYQRLSKSAFLPKTSQPSPADFTATYTSLAEEGYTDIVSIHLARLSQVPWSRPTWQPSTHPYPSEWSTR